MSALPKNVEDIHPSLWRGSQLGRSTGIAVDTGYPALSEQLPGGSWPRGALIAHRQCCSARTDAHAV
jgi:hypothetical protein